MRSLIFSLVILSGFISWAEGVKPMSIEVDYNDLRMDGTLDREAARRAMSAKKQDFAACGFVDGKLDLSFQVSEDGKTTDSKSVLSPKRDQKTEDCFKAVLSQVNFGFSGTQQSTKMSLQFDIGVKERKAAQEQQRQSQETEQAKIETNKIKSVETEADRKNREYLEQVRANALREMNEQAAKQNAQLKTTLACNDTYSKDHSLEAYNRCLDQAKYGGISESAKTCNKTCESQRMNLEVQCHQRCSGGHVARNNCISSCQRNIASQADLCKTGCR